MDNDPVVTMSPLCQSCERDGRAVQVEIYEGDSKKWILEVVDEFNNSTLWQEQFDTDQLALEEVLKTVEEEGIESLIGPPSSSLG